MEESATRTDIRQADGRTTVIDIRGDVTAASEPALMSAYEEAARHGSHGGWCSTSAALTT